MRHALLLPVMLLATGCAHRTMGVEQRLLMPGSTARYEMAPNQAFVFPAPLDNAAPGFPVDYAPRELVQTTVCVAFVVDAEGQVARVSLLREEPGCGGAEAPAPLRDATLEAVGAWRFTPAMFCDYPDAATRDRDWNGRGCAGADVRARAVPVSLAYAFTFEIHEGRQRVATAKR